jgi:hypothetical protein
VAAARPKILIDCNFHSIFKIEFSCLHDTLDHSLHISFTIFGDSLIRLLSVCQKNVFFLFFQFRTVANMQATWYSSNKRFSNQASQCKKTSVKNGANTNFMSPRLAETTLNVCMLLHCTYSNYVIENDQQ